MPTVKLSSKGQVAIPKAIRDRLRLKKDMRLEVSVEHSLILLKPLRDDAWLGLEGNVSPRGLGVGAPKRD